MHALILAVALGGSAPVFQDITEVAGLDAPHRDVYLVTGQAWGDLDRDGYDDLYVTSSAGPNSLWRNRGDGTFERVATGGLLELEEQISGGASIADYDNDGLPDLLVLGRGAPALFRNLGGMAFEEVSEQAGLTRVGEGESAAWGDFDRDGDLDLYIAHWYYQQNAGLPESRDVLYRNQGDGTFVDVTHLLDDDRTGGPAFAAIWFDYDNDADDDLYVVNDKNFGNLLWRNDGPGCGGWCFTDVSIATGAHRPSDSMGIAFGDYDNDGDFDIAYPGVDENILLQNQWDQGAAAFIEVSGLAGVAIDGVGWAPVFGDVDNDGWPDLYLNIMMSPTGAANRLFMNAGDGTFQASPAGSITAGGDVSIGAAMSDFDRDGDLDFVLGNSDQDYRLHANRLDPENDSGWLRLELIGRHGLESTAVGARVEVERDDGLVQLQQLHLGSGMGGNHGLALHFGLGGAAVAEVRIAWPDGVSQVVPGPLQGAVRIDYPDDEERFWKDGFEP